MNPFMSFCLYVAARVYVQYLKAHPTDETTLSSLQFLLTAMNAFKAKNPLTGSFLAQLDVDLEGSGLENPRNVSKFSYGLQKGVVSDYHLLVRFETHNHLTNYSARDPTRW